MIDDVKGLLPQHKGDVDRAKAMVLVGYPTVAPVLSELFVWLQDANWPVAHIIAPFLASIGEPVVPEIRQVLGTQDGLWKYWVLSEVVAKSPRVVRILKDDLMRIVTNPTSDEASEEVNIIAQDILSILDDNGNNE